MHKHWRQPASTLVLSAVPIPAVCLALFAPSLRAQSQTPPTGVDPKLLARAKDGDADAQFNLAGLYYDGKGVPQD
jgi:hypothetical protein